MDKFLWVAPAGGLGSLMIAILALRRTYFRDRATDTKDEAKDRKAAEDQHAAEIHILQVEVAQLKQARQDCMACTSLHPRIMTLEVKVATGEANMAHLTADLTSVADDVDSIKVSMTGFDKRLDKLENGQNAIHRTVQDGNDSLITIIKMLGKQEANH